MATVDSNPLTELQETPAEDTQQTFDYTPDATNGEAIQKATEQNEEQQEVTQDVEVEDRNENQDQNH